MNRRAACRNDSFVFLEIAEHLKHAFSYGFRSLQCSIVFIIHGIVPCLFENTGSTTIRKLNDDLQYNSNKKYDNNVDLNK